MCIKENGKMTKNKDMEFTQKMRVEMCTQEISTKIQEQGKGGTTIEIEMKSMKEIGFKIKEVAKVL